MLKKTMSVVLALTMAIGMLMSFGMSASAAEVEVYPTSIHYGAMWGDNYESWTVTGAWNCWGVNVYQGSINQGVLAVPLRSPTIDGDVLRSGGQYVWSDSVTVTLAETTLVTRVVLKSENDGEFPNNICLNYRDANTPNPTQLELAADSWRYIDRMAAGYEGVAKTVNTSGNTMEIIFQTPVLANAVQVQALANNGQAAGGKAWTISEFHVYTTDDAAGEPSEEPSKEPSEEPSKEPGEALKGDVTGDGKINASDATRVLLSSVGKVELDEAQTAAADVNGDGKINAVDASLILLHSVGKKSIA